MSPRTYLFVDGSNLYGSQYELLGPNHYLSFTKLTSNVEQLLGLTFDSIYFYASYSPRPIKATKKQEQFLKNEGLFYRDVKSSEKVIFFKGYRSPTSGKEKEVDVKLAVDIVNFAHRQKYSSMYLMSGDADFLHALLAVKNLKKDVNLLCLSNNILFRALIHFKTNIIHLGGVKPLIKGYNNKPTWLSLEDQSVIKKV